MKAEVLDATKLIEFADDNFKLDKNDGSIFKWVEKSVGKGEIAPYKEFLLMKHCFLKILTADT